MITEAEYNPREITEEAYEGLGDVLKEHGLAVPLVWNEKTGVLISGHRRLAIMDEKAGDADYELTVLAPSFDEKKERRANVMLNNPSAQGRFDIVMLGQIIKETGLEGTGFTPETITLHVAPSDADVIFGRKPVKSVSAPPPMPKAAESHLMIVFQSRVNSDAFAERWGFDPNNRYMDGTALLNLVKRTLGK